LVEAVVHGVLQHVDVAMTTRPTTEEMLARQDRVVASL